ncbi:MAG TPA: hypothetical protein VFD58_10895 [Blastocatellia bacterium]|nr:hypothetical protein [Blastocatellia bacterium]
MATREFPELLALRREQSHADNPRGFDVNTQVLASLESDAIVMTFARGEFALGRLIWDEWPRLRFLCTANGLTAGWRWEHYLKQEYADTESCGAEAPRQH